MCVYCVKEGFFREFIIEELLGVFLVMFLVAFLVVFLGVFLVWFWWCGMCAAWCCELLVGMLQIFIARRSRGGREVVITLLTLQINTKIVWENIFFVS